VTPLNRQIVWLLVSATLFAGVGFQIPAIKQQRERDRLVVTGNVADNAPPLIAFTQLALGSFRGLVSEVLFLRAMRLKQMNRVFDAKQLSDLIGQLNPRYAAVWAFNSWNMAYNISVTMSSGPERWRWVDNGIRLLRDQAIPLNPDSTELYKSLAWTYFHKIGQWSDHEHWYHKYRLAVEVERVIGPDSSKETVQRLVEAPTSLEKFLEDSERKEIHDEFLERGIKDARTYCLLVEADYRGKGGISPGVFDKASPFAEDQQTIGQKVITPHMFNDVQFGLLQYEPDDERRRLQLKDLDSFWRAQRLRDVLKLDPKFMLKLMDELGPLDWRTAEASAIYWSAFGMSKARGTLDTHELNTDRIVYQSITNLVRQGKLEWNPGSGQLYMKPDLRFIESLVKHHEMLIEKYTGEKVKKDDPYYYSFDRTGPYGMGYRNFLEEAVKLCYQYNDLGRANRFYRKLRDIFPQKRYDVSLEKFAQAEIKALAFRLSQRDAVAQILSFLGQGWYYMSMSDLDKADGFRKFAKFTYQFYQTSTRGQEQGDRMALPPWEKLQHDSLRDTVFAWARQGENDPKWLRLIAVLKAEFGDPKQVDEIIREFQEQTGKSAAQKQAAYAIPPVGTSE
jgi:hypothetical protein